MTVSNAIQSSEPYRWDRPDSKKVDDVFCKLFKPGRKAVSPETMDDAVRRRMRDRYK